MGELVKQFPQFEGLVSQSLPDDVAVEDDGVGDFGVDDEEGGVEDDAPSAAAPSAAERRSAAKRKGRQAAEEREAKIATKVKGRTRETVKTAETMASTMLHGLRPLFVPPPVSSSSKWSEAADKAESEQQQLQLSVSQMTTHKLFSDEFAALEKAKKGGDFRARFLRVQLKQLEAKMLPPDSDGAAANGGSGAGTGAGSPGAGDASSGGAGMGGGGPSSSSSDEEEDEE